MSDSSTRRQFLTLGGMFAAGAALADVCALTPPQTEGPFYPLSKITDDSINDLGIIEGHTTRAKGTVITIQGTVTDAGCRPVEGALVEIWQAAASGRYNHPSDNSGLALDPDFQGWGEYLTGADGRYAFRTIVPGHYPADTNWIRPPHIHYKVTRRGYRELVTQMYFAPESFEGDRRALIDRLNTADLILNEVSDKASVVRRFAPAAGSEAIGSLLAYRQQGANVRLVKVGDLTTAPGELTGTFDLALRPVRG